MFQRRFNLQRNYLLPRVTKKSRAIAIIAAFIFGLIYFIEITFLEQFHSIFLLIAIIALVYSFRKPQDTKRNNLPMSFDFKKFALIRWPGLVPGGCGPVCLSRLLQPLLGGRLVLQRRFQKPGIS